VPGSAVAAILLQAFEIQFYDFRDWSFAAVRLKVTIHLPC